MKNFVVILLLIIFSATQFASVLSDVGAPVIHAICYGQVFKRQASRSGNRIFVLDSAEVRKSMTDDSEIRLHGELFDIVATTKIGDSIRLEVASDEFETQLFNIVQHIKDAVKKAPGTNHHNKQLQSWLLKLYCPNEARANLLLPGSVSSTYIRLQIPPIQPGVHNRHLQPPDRFI